MSKAKRYVYIYGEIVNRLYPRVTVAIERITPRVAEQMLERNTHNRSPKREPIKKALTDGQWVLNGATIVFDYNGVLMDGQNRLIACVKSGIPFDTVVVRGVDPKSQWSMDTNVKRQLGDQLQLKGYPGSRNLGGVGTALYRKDRFGLAAVFNKPAGDEFTMNDILQFIDKNYDERIKPLITMTKPFGHLYKGLGLAPLCAIFDEFLQAGNEDVEEFIRQLRLKSNPCKPVALLRERLTRNLDSGSTKMPQKVMAALTIKAWNAYMQGEEITQLKFTQGGAHPEAFPKVFTGYADEQ